MTLTIELPTDLEVDLRARAALSGRDLPEVVVGLLRRTTRAVPPPRLATGVYPEEPDAGDDASYHPVPLASSGAVVARFVPAGPLTPASFAADE